MDAHLDVQMDGWASGSMGNWASGCADGWADGWPLAKRILEATAMKVFTYQAPNTLEIGKYHLVSFFLPPDSRSRAAVLVSRAELKRTTLYVPRGLLFLKVVI